MADNIQLNTGTGGSILAADDVSSVFYQKVKIDVGGDGVSAALSTTNPIPVDATYAEDAAHTTGDRGRFILGVRLDADTSPVSTDGDYHPFVFNAFGRLKASVLPAATAATTGAITTSSTSIPIDVQRQSNVTIMIAGTHAGINFTFEGSNDGGTTYFGVQAVRMDTGAIETATGVITSNATRAWEVSVNGLTHFRVRSTAFTSGSGAITLSPGSFATEPIIAVGGSLPAGTATIGAVNIASAQTLATVTTVGTVTTCSTVTNITNQGHGADDAAFTVGTTRVMVSGFLADETATDSVDEGDMGAARITLDRKQIVAPYAHTAGGATPGRLVSAASTNGTVVKASAGTLYALTVINLNAAVRYLKVYNSASVTVGSTTPTWTFPIPANSTTGAGIAIPIPACGIAFGTGLCLGLTTGIADSDTGAVAANEIVVNYAYL